ncbi:MAG: twin-arginine translocase subunit TatC [Dehalococcoidia bacterium]|nr:twin-arginine translocase subunit TatC [Dehalococcoidia bacterium]
MSADSNPAVAAPPKAESEGKELTILEHLQELRQRLMIAAGALILATVGSLVLTNWLLGWLTAPARNSVEDVRIIFTDPLGYWGAYFRVALLSGVTIAMPVIVYEVLAFVGPGLTRQERRWVYPLVIGASLAFVAGGAFAYYIELPPALRFLLNSGGGIEPFINVTSYIDFITRLMLVTGIVFEMPLVIMALAKLHVVSSRKLISWWRYAIVLAFVAAAVVTPSIDPVTQSLVAGPIIVLYFTGIILAKVVERGRNNS